ncbi:cupin domain-containing protein [Sphingomonas soli]|uniref:cupin domain-containing protein n=1 Tax=Sphingomonas soli TaxID=266127 RepID=UPI0008366DAC|nr:cupin domain-containing protein [Sphingomonas soli]
MKPDRIRALVADEVPARTSTTYPAEFARRVHGRSKQVLGDPFGVGNFGVNRVTLPPGCQSSVRHRHLVQDEFVYVLAGELTLIDDDGELTLRAGMCAGFRHGGPAHHLVNRSAEDSVYLEVGDRLPGDAAEYPDDDLRAVRSDSGWSYTQRDGTPWSG